MNILLGSSVSFGEMTNVELSGAALARPVEAEGRNELERFVMPYQSRFLSEWAISLLME